MRSLLQIDLTRTYQRRAELSLRPRGQSRPTDGFSDISPTEIERRYQARLADAVNRDVFSLMRAFSAYLGSVNAVVGSGDPIADQRHTEVNVFEFMCMNMIPDGQNKQPNPWAAMALQHFLSALS